MARNYMARNEWLKNFFLCELVFWCAVWWADDYYELRPEEVKKYLRLMITTNAIFGCVKLIEWHVKASESRDGCYTICAITLFGLQCINNLVLHILSYYIYDMNVQEWLMKENGARPVLYDIACIAVVVVEYLWFIPFALFGLFWLALLFFYFILCIVKRKEE